jgi:sugar/nucleoside kinase (ribokinase family)
VEPGARRLSDLGQAAEGTLPQVLMVGGSCLSALVHACPVPGHEPADGVHVHTAAGCMGAGKALNLRRLGFPTTLHSVLGDDQPGARVRALLTGEGPPVVHDLDPAGTTLRRHFGGR